VDELDESKHGACFVCKHELPVDRCKRLNIDGKAAYVAREVLNGLCELQALRAKRAEDAAGSPSEQCAYICQQCNTTLLGIRSASEKLKTLTALVMANIGDSEIEVQYINMQSHLDFN